MKDTNKPESVAPVLIYDRLAGDTNKTNPVNADQMTEYLKEKYGISISSKTVKRQLDLLLDEDLCIFKGKGGYYYDPDGYDAPEFYDE